MMKRVIVGTLLLAQLACSKKEPPAAVATPPPPPTVTTATFDPVYRAAKTIQGAIVSGVTYQKFGELMQSLSTEIEIAKDHKLNDADKKLLGLYQEAFAHYQVSLGLWTEKNNASEKWWKGEIPVWFEKHPNPLLLAMAERYGIPVSDRTMEYGLGKYKSIPGDSVQRVWAEADKTLLGATALFYGNGNK